MMASFAGTTQKCKACEKTVYLVDQLTADNKIYHKSCFRCYHCKGTLKLSNYCSFEGVLYCKPHFDQLFKKTGSLDKSFEGIPRTARLERSADQVQTNTKVSNLFAGTQEKCVACKKTVYPIEKLLANGKSNSLFSCWWRRRHNNNLVPIHVFVIIMAVDWGNRKKRKKQRGWKQLLDHKFLLTSGKTLVFCIILCRKSCINNGTVHCSFSGSC
ncbi:LIM domain-containing protein WLIM1-like isoform X1 [Glycine max]|uniref:LIM domain-containing protein WLIM1-like isoform X1 n=1 Tax=Glycine max TaxID=3847 RepID=UPI001B355586|nr:uncharacterized protein LOC100500444 isoform X1 [Glycine max]